MSAARQLADMIMAGVGRLIPPREHEWAEAMAAEQAEIRDHRDALAFSAGCLRAAGWQRARALAPDGSWFWPGLAIAILLLGTAAIPRSGSSAFVWAPVGGLMTVLTLENFGGRLSFGRIVLLAFKAGAMSALLFLAVALFLFLPEGDGRLARIAQLSFVAALMTLFTTISGAAAAPLLSNPPSAGAPQPRRSIDMAMARHPGTSAGLALGLLYLVEAVFNTGLLFAVWPILGGIFAAALVKWNPGTDLTAGSGARAGAKAGLVGGLVLLVAGTPLTLYLMRKLGEEPGFFGITFDMGPIPTLLTIFSIYVLFGILVAAATGALTGMLAGRAGSRTDHAVRH
ncbi:MAG TPA: hypothetical protein VEZ41_13725 [Allosphingosinicella sp.]|jgi:hypothetical protein|nr:hypothetical protein [Allosphingosinicella sp.]